MNNEMFEINNFDDLIGNKKTMIEWRDAIHNIKKGDIVLIRGSSGIGKTIGSKLLIKECNLNALFIDTSVSVDGKDILDRILKFHNWTDLTNTFSSAESNADNKKIIVIDEIESFAKIDRNVLNIILSYNITYKENSIPIVLVGHDDILKKLGDIKNYITVNLKIQRLNDIDIFLFFKKRLPRNKIKIADLMKIIEDANGNIYSTMQTISSILQNKKGMCILQSFVGDEQKSLQEIFECSNPIVVDKLLSEDDWTNPLKIHENIIKVLDGDIYKDFLEKYLFYELLHSRLEQGIDNTIPIMYLSFIIILSVKKQNSDGKIDTLDFSKLLSYISTKKKYKKLLYDKVPMMYPIEDLGLYWIHEVSYPSKNKIKNIL